MVTTQRAEQIAKFLLDIGAVKFNADEPFKWSSGILSPIYCDNRVINSNIEVRDAVKDGFCEIIISRYNGGADIIGAVATGGIPYGALVADKLRLPFLYVRSGKKAHGLMKNVEGAFNKGERVVLIEDLVSTGGSSMNAVEALKEEGLVVTGLLSIMTYGFKKAGDLFQSAGLPFESLCNLDVILKVAGDQGVIASGDAEKILEFRKQYGG